MANIITFPNGTVVRTDQIAMLYLPEENEKAVAYLLVGNNRPIYQHFATKEMRDNNYDLLTKFMEELELCQIKK